MRWRDCDIPTPTPIKKKKVKFRFSLAPNIMISTLVLSPAGLESLHLANGEERGFVAPPAFTFGNPLMEPEKATRETREPKSRAAGQKM